MAGLFDGNSDNEIDIGTNNEYAKRYDTWRGKEVFQKLKDRYGDEAALGKVDDDSSTSEEEDEDAKELTQQLEKDFFKTLSYLKKKDPSIYDKEVKFFKEINATDANEDSKTKRIKSEKPLFLRDYERKLIVERSGKLSDDEDERPDTGHSSTVRVSSPTLVQEQQAIKNSFKAVLQDSDDEENAWGGLFESRKKSSEELKKENDGYYEWLKGQQDDIKDKNVKSDLKHLHDYWNDPKLDSNEVFLKDYILNKKFLELEDKDHVPTYDEIVHDSDEDLAEDEATVAKQEEFEHKYNFRFEEPDQEFIKRYPRTMENSLRRKDTRRKEKREDVKERKVAQKDRKKEELKQLKALKRKEIMEKIEKLKLITGNANVGFQDEDVEGDFNPAEYDKRMSQLFTNEFYGEEDNDEKPEFPEIDEELELENWNSWGVQEINPDPSNDNYEPHCDDPNFNMDCDYNPNAQFQSEIIEPTKRKKKGRKSKLSEALAKQKPIFDPNDRTFEEYVDEYYGMDFEDVIGDLPCRFKYRSVLPNSFGLTIDEILKANDKELNQWCSLKKAVQIRPDYVERKDLERYQKKATNFDYKRKILTSLYNDNNEEQADQVKKRKKKKSNKLKIETADSKNMKDTNIEDAHKNTSETELATSSSTICVDNLSLPSGKMLKKRKIHDLIELPCTKEHIKKRKVMDLNTVESTDSASVQVDTSRKKKKKETKKHSKLKESTQNTSSDIGKKEPTKLTSELGISRRRKKNRKKKINDTQLEELQLHVKKTKVNSLNEKKVKKGSFKDKKVKEEQEPGPFSDSRLKAYGLHPKKFKNYLKYGKTEK